MSSEHLSQQIPDNFVRKTKIWERGTSILGPGISGVGGYLVYDGQINNRTWEMGLGIGLVVAESVRSTTMLNTTEKVREKLRTVRTALRTRGQ